MKYSLTKNTKEWGGKTLYQIKAEASFSVVTKGDLGGWIEKEENLSQGGDAWVYGNAQVYAKASFTKGWFVGGSDSDKITDITDKTGSTYWKHQYVLGDYEITPIEKKPALSDDELIAELERRGKIKSGKIVS